MAKSNSRFGTWFEDVGEKWLNIAFMLFMVFGSLWLIYGYLELPRRATIPFFIGFFGAIAWFVRSSIQSKKDAEASELRNTRTGQQSALSRVSDLGFRIFLAFVLASWAGGVGVLFISMIAHGGDPDCGGVPMRYC